DQIEDQGNHGPKKSGSERGLERQPGRHHQAPAQHDAGVDQEVEHDAEEVEPAGRLALFRNGFDAELLDAGGLTVARAQLALDVDCGGHGQFCAPPRPRSMRWLESHTLPIDGLTTHRYFEYPHSDLCAT